MSVDAVPIALFARAPRPGGVKTRLVPALGPEKAAALYRAFLEDTRARVAALPELEPRVWAATPDDAEALARELGEEVATQRGADLGERMQAALAEGVRRAGRAIVIGTDAPTLPASLLRAALRALDEAELVLGPAHDGGFTLIAVRDRVPPLGPGVRWSTRHALADTLAISGTPARLLRPWYDVDTPDDLRLLAAHLALRPSAAPATARALRAPLRDF